MGRRPARPATGPLVMRRPASYLDIAGTPRAWRAGARGSASPFCLPAPERRRSLLRRALRGRDSSRGPRQRATDAGRRRTTATQSEQTTPTAPPGGDRGAGRHHLARRRAMPRRDHDLRGEARGRRLPRRHGRRHHRGGVPDRLEGRLRGRLGDRRRASRTPSWAGSRAPPRRTSTAPAKRCGTPSAGASTRSSRPAPCT